MPNDVATTSVAGHTARAKIAQAHSFVLRTIEPEQVRAQVVKRGRPAVLRIVVNHATVGFFAAFQWVLLAMRFASKAGLHAYVDHGACTLCGHAPFSQQYKYYDVDAGPNVWEYYFKMVDPGFEALVQGNAQFDVVTLGTWEVWRLYGATLTPAISAYQGAKDAFDRPFWQASREKAWTFFDSNSTGLKVQLNDAFAEKEASMWHALQLHGLNAMAKALPNLSATLSALSHALTPQLALSPPFIANHFVIG